MVFFFPCTNYTGERGEKKVNKTCCQNTEFPFIATRLLRWDFAGFCAGDNSVSDLFNRNSYDVKSLNVLYVELTIGKVI